MIKYLRMAATLLLTFTLSVKAGAQNQPNIVVANGQTTAPINFPGAGCQYLWTNDTPSIGLAASGTGNIPPFTAINKGSKPVTATITAVPSAAPGYAYMPNGADNTVTAVNLSTNTVAARINIFFPPDGEAISPDGSAVYASIPAYHALSVISTATNTLANTLPLIYYTTGAGYILTDLSYVQIAGQPTDVAVSPDGKTIYVANTGIAYTFETKDDNGNVTGKTNLYVIYAIDAATGTVNMMTVYANPSALCVSRDGSSLYVSSGDSNYIYVVDLQQTKPVHPIVIQGSKNPVVSAGLAVIKAGIPTSETPNLMALSPDGSMLYVANVNASTVSAISTSSNSVIASIHVGQGPSGICISPDGSKVYVSNVISHSISVISTATNTVLYTYNSLDSPSVLSISANGKLLYVNDASEGDLDILDATSTSTRILKFIDLGSTAGGNGGEISNFITPPGNCTSSTQTFTITVNPTLSANASLSALHLSAGTLSPAFTTANTSYTESVTNAIASITVTAKPTDTAARLTVNGVAVASGAASPAIALNTGANTITVVVTAADGFHSQTYTISVTRAAPPNDNLATLHLSAGNLSPSFAAVTTSYSESVTNAVTTITVTAKPADAAAVMKVNGTVVAYGATSQNIALAPGANTINVSVTNGGATKIYTVTVKRTASAVATVATLHLSAGTLSPAFAPATTSYSESVTNAIASVTVTAKTTDVSATIKVNGMAVPSGAASPAIPLTAGANSINVNVTAGDGVTTKNYNIIVTRAPSAVALLSSMHPSNGTLSPAFSPPVTAYTASVTNAISSITITPKAADTNATITVNGILVKSGAVSQAIPLGIGANNITTIVTAQDGITTKTYTLTLTRAAPSGNDVVNTTDYLDSKKTVSTLSFEPFDDDILLVHPAVSPNGDGINDVLTIDGILAYPDNTLQIISLTGELVYEAKSYDNKTKAFDGHSNKTGKRQAPGTYYYMLQYTRNGVAKSKTGYIVVKY